MAENKWVSLIFFWPLEVELCTPTYNWWPWSLSKKGPRFQEQKREIASRGKISEGVTGNKYLGNLL